MIRTVFVDAACFVSLINPRDQMHQTAINALSAVDGAELLTTDAVRYSITTPSVGITSGAKRYESSKI